MTEETTATVEAPEEPLASVNDEDLLTGLVSTEETDEEYFDGGLLSFAEKQESGQSKRFSLDFPDDETVPEGLRGKPIPDMFVTINRAEGNDALTKFMLSIRAKYGKGRTKELPHEVQEWVTPIFTGRFIIDSLEGVVVGKRADGTFISEVIAEYWAKPKGSKKPRRVKGTLKFELNDDGTIKTNDENKINFMRGFASNLTRQVVEKSSAAEYWAGAIDAGKS